MNNYCNKIYLPYRLTYTDRVGINGSVIRYRLYLHVVISDLTFHFKEKVIFFQNLAKMCQFYGRGHLASFSLRKSCRSSLVTSHPKQTWPTRLDKIVSEMEKIINTLRIQYYLVVLNCNLCRNRPRVSVKALYFRLATDKVLTN